MLTQLSPVSTLNGTHPLRGAPRESEPRFSLCGNWPRPFTISTKPLSSMSPSIGFESLGRCLGRYAARRHSRCTVTGGTLNNCSYLESANHCITETNERLRVRMALPNGSSQRTQQRRVDLKPSIYCSRRMRITTMARMNPIVIGNILAFSTWIP